MNKSRIAVLLLFLVLSPPLFSNQESCRETEAFEMGLQDATNQKARLLRAIGWGAFSYMVIGGAGELGSMVGWLYFPNHDYFMGIGPNAVYGALIGAGIGTVLSIAIPALVVHRPTSIPDQISEENVECYRDGYARGTRRNRVRGAVIGCALTWASAITYSLLTLK